VAWVHPSHAQTSTVRAAQHPARGLTFRLRFFPAEAHLHAEVSGALPPLRQVVAFQVAVIDGRAVPNRLQEAHRSDHARPIAHRPPRGKRLAPVAVPRDGGLGRLKETGGVGRAVERHAQSVPGDEARRRIVQFDGHPRAEIERLEVLYQLFRHGSPAAVLIVADEGAHSAHHGRVRGEFAGAPAHGAFQPEKVIFDKRERFLHRFALLLLHGVTHLGHPPGLEAPGGRQQENQK